MPNANPETTIQEIPYIVNILKNKTPWCSGAILSPNIVLSAAHCFSDKNAHYHVLSNSDHRTLGRPHFVLTIITHPGFHPPSFKNDLALINIFPKFDLKYSFNRKIELRNIPIHPNEMGSLSGWGCIQYTSP